MTALRIRTTRPVMLISWSVCLIASAIVLFGATPSPAIQFIPFALSMVFLGLPHGAVDHLIPFRLLKRSVSVRGLAAIIAAYVALAGVYLLAWIIAPLPSALFFILLTWFHWGQGDLHALLRLHRAQHVRTTPTRLLAILIRGGLPMLIPLIAFPDIYLAVLDSFVQVFRPNVTAYASLTLSFTARLSVALIFALIVVAYAAITRRQATTPAAARLWQRDLFEIGLLVVFFATVPPVLAVGLYFCFWHSLRHIARIISLDNGLSSTDAIDWRAGFARFVRDSIPLTAISLTFLVVVYVGVTQFSSNSADLLALYLVLISALTLPHTAVVLWMDRREGIWQSAPKRPSKSSKRKAPAMQTSPARQ